MRIKEQIAAAPRSVQVEARENFIDQKFKRRLKRTVAAVTASVAQSPNLVDPLPNGLKEIPQASDEPTTEAPAAPVTPPKK